MLTTCRWQSALSILKTSCGNLWTGAVPDNTDAEIQTLQKAIQTEATAANEDPRFILAIMLQESKGCLRIPTTVSNDKTVRNPGIFQDHDGANSCNANGDDDAAIALIKPKNATLLLSPCPDNIITGMVQDGVSGTAKGDGLAGVLNLPLAPGVAARQATTGAYVSDGVLVQWNATNQNATSLSAVSESVIVTTATTFQTVFITAARHHLQEQHRWLLARHWSVARRVLSQ